jgi:photosystem II stability/assembly factor-like uncharacterized protein
MMSWRIFVGLIWLLQWKAAWGASPPSTLTEIGPLPGGPSEPIKGIHFLGEKTAWCFSSQRLWRTLNGGASWSEVALPLPPQHSGGRQILFGDFESSEAGWILILQGGVTFPFAETIYRTNDGGGSWQEQPPLPLQDGIVRTVSFRPGGLVGWVGGVRKNPNVRITVVPGCISPPNASILEPDIFHTIDGGRHWAKQALPEQSGCPVSTIVFRNDNDGVAVSGHHLYYTADAGQRGA